MNRHSYLTEQLCTIAMAGAYASVMMAMYRSASDAPPGVHTLLSVLVPWIQVAVLIGSWVLLALVILRAAAVWRAAGASHAQEHDQHDQEHEHDHDHPQGHDHDHGHAHSWSPWRYAVLLFPLMLFFLDIDYNDKISRFLKDLTRQSAPAAPEGALSAGPSQALSAMGVLALSQSPLDQAFAVMTCQFGWSEAAALQLVIDRLDEEAAVSSSEVVQTDVGMMEHLGSTPDERDLWKKYRRVEAAGILEPNAKDKRMFRLVRVRMACCLGDARPASVIGMSRSRVHIPSGQWVTIQGRVDFAQFADGKWRPIFRASKIIPTTPPLNFYLK